MSLSQKNLSFIQKAGQAVHSASQVVSASVQAQAESTVASVASQPFGTESEQAITRFKMLARLNQGLISVEAQLQELFSIATELASPASDVVIALPYKAKRSSSNATAVDAAVKPSKTVKGTKKKVKDKSASRTVISSASLTANDTSLLQYLQSVLKLGEDRRITGGAMATGSGLPLGSIGISLRKILASGAVTSSARGLYQLAPTSATPDPTPEVKRKPAKKAKSALTKITKSGLQPQDSTPAAEASGT